MITQMVKEDKIKCEKCFGKGYHVDVDSLGKIFVEPCPNNAEFHAQFYCDVVNKEKIDPEEKQELAKLRNKSLQTSFLDVLREFIKDWPKIKKQKSHYDIVKNPEIHHIVRPIKDQQFTTMHLLTRNQVFQVLSKHDREKKTRKDEFFKTIDIPEVRTFLGWDDRLHFKISGPVLCTYDEEVYNACIKLWHENNTKGIVIETNLSEIWRKIGNVSRLNSTKIESLKRSLSRLVDISVTVSSMENKSFWAGGIIDSVMYNEFSNTKNHQVLISFNKHMIYQYLGGMYAKLEHGKYKIMSAYAKKMYEFLCSHDDPNRKMGLDKWRIVLGIKESLDDKEFKRKICEAIKELIELKILLPESTIDKKGFVFTFFSPEAWNERTDKPNF